jgi:hypothetical protein
MTGGNYRSNYHGLQYAHAASPGYHRSLTVRSHARNQLTSTIESTAARCCAAVMAEWVGRVEFPRGRGSPVGRDSVLNQIEGFLEVVVCFGKQVAGRLNLVHCRGGPGRRSWDRAFRH